MQKGLSSEKAAALLRRYGENLLSGERRQNAAGLFASQFKDLLTLILLCSTVISLLLGEYVDAVTIMAIVFINAVLGFSQEYRTERTLEHLRAIAAPKATVYRDGEKVEVPARELVPGDVVALTAGCKVPADGRVLSATELFANESLLTGESMAVQKAPSFGEGGRAALRCDFVYGHGDNRRSRRICRNRNGYGNADGQNRRTFAGNEGGANASAKAPWCFEQVHCRRVHNHLPCGDTDRNFARRTGI